jgi:RNA polymerase sigma-70 factor (ECF subfamily)
MEIRVPLPLVAGAEKACSAPEQELCVLFEELRAPVIRFLLFNGVNAQDAEEIVQDTFLALLDHLRMGRPRTNLRGWVFRVAHNLALKTMRIPAAAGLDREAPAPGLDPEQLACLSERHRKIAAVIRALPARDRACLQLRAHGLPYREIAAVLDVSLGAVALSIERGLSRIREAGAD